jgi:hypothetical protein
MLINLKKKKKKKKKKGLLKVWSFKKVKDYPLV